MGLYDLFYLHNIHIILLVKHDYSTHSIFMSRKGKDKRLGKVIFTINVFANLYNMN